jgi:15-cis-phytoene synthase
MISSVNFEVSDTAHDYCISKATPESSNLYYATIFDGTKNKTIIITLYAFLYELSDIIHECSDPGIARIKLKWWQEEIERLFNKQARHPVTRQMQECIRFDPDLKSTFNSIIDFFNRFIFIKQPESLESILSLYKSTTGEISYQCGLQLNPEKTGSLDIIRELGALIHFTDCLQQPRTYINETRCIIPASYIDNINLLKLRIDTANKHTREKEIFSPLFMDLKTRLDKTYKALNRKENHMFQYTLILNRLAFKTCDEILRDGCNLLGTNVSLTPLRKLWIAWWTRFSM